MGFVGGMVSSFLLPLASWNKAWLCCGTNGRRRTSRSI